MELIKNKPDTRPLYSLTVDEYRELHRSMYNDCGTVKVQNHDTRYEKGILGIAKALKVSKPTAQRIKNSGVLDPAISQCGRSILLNVDLAIQLLNKSKDKGGKNEIKAKSPFFKG